MDSWAILICGVVGLTVSWSLIPVIQRLATRRTEAPTDRSFHHTHTTSIPRFGGVAMAAAFVVLVLLSGALTGFTSASRPAHWGMVMGSLAMFALGLRDDFKPLGAKFKLLAQLLV